MARPEPELVAFGEAVRRARTERAWSQIRLAEKLSAELGEPVSQGAVTQWERGIVAPRREKVAALERVLGTGKGELAQLLDGLPRDPDAGADVIELNSKVARLSPEARAAVMAIVDQMLGPEG